MLLPLLSAAPHLPHAWPIAVPVVIGAAAIYLLLPRPQAYPALWGGLLGAAALVLAGVYLARAGWLSPETFLFYAFSGIAIVAGTLLVTQSNPARAALSFALVVLSTCGLFLLLAAPFLMAATIIIYAGAIIVTFLFVLMLAQQTGLDNADLRSREPLLAVVTGFALLGALLYLLQVSYGTQDVDGLLARTRRASALPDAAAIRSAVEPDTTDPGHPAPTLFDDYGNYFRARGWGDLDTRVNALRENRWGALENKASADELREVLADLEKVGEEARNRLGALQPAGAVRMSNASGPPATVPFGELRRNNEGVPQLPQENSGHLGKSLFTDYLLPVELGGTLLLVAAIGAIAIAHRKGDRAGGDRTVGGGRAV